MLPRFRLLWPSSHHIIQASRSGYTISWTRKKYVSFRHYDLFRVRIDGGWGFNPPPPQFPCRFHCAPPNPPTSQFLLCCWPSQFIFHNNIRTLDLFRRYLNWEQSATVRMVACVVPVFPYNHIALYIIVSRLFSPLFVISAKRFLPCQLVSLPDFAIVFSVLATTFQPWV